MKLTRRRPQAVQLTSLLDLLFVMIFVSLLQQQNQAPPVKEVKKEVKAAKPVAPKELTKVKNEPQMPSQFGVQATFNFYATSDNPNVPSGTFLMQGQFHRDSGKIQLGGIAWIQRPQNYDMVPLNGVIDLASDSFQGKIPFIGCKEFTLSRKLKEGKTKISGQWVGEYDCSQGKTGLTLTIK